MVKCWRSHWIAEEVKDTLRKGDLNYNNYAFVIAQKVPQYATVTTDSYVTVPAFNNGNRNTDTGKDADRTKSGILVRLKES